MRLKNTLVQGKMNKDVDERLVPNGQYSDALNIRVSNTDGADVGAVENVKGNEALTSLELTNAKTLGKYADGSNQKIYWFVTSDEKDLVLEYDVSNDTLATLLESTNGLLGFSPNNLITGVTKIITSEEDKDLLIWTDDLNPIRCINIKRSKGYGVDNFDEFDINLIKRPPTYAPDCLAANTGGEENNLENKFLSFATRFKYLDGEFSALSPFSNAQFYPNSFNLDFQTMENEGMVNSFNAVDIRFDTGDKRVTDVELVFKESNSNTVYIVETFNKVNQGWGHNETQSFRYSENTGVIALPQEELGRLYDNVPRTAKALELVGSRLVLGNYLEQYDIVDDSGNEIKLDYTLSRESKDITGEELTTTAAIGTSTLIVSLLDIDLNRGGRLTLEFSLGDQTLASNSFGVNFTGGIFSFIMPRDFSDIADLTSDPDFISFVEDTMTQAFVSGYSVANPPADGVVIDAGAFSISNTSSSSFTITKSPVVWEISGGPATEEQDLEFKNPSGFYSEISVNTSLKTNRSYEAALIYKDGYGRATTALTVPNNVLTIPQEFSTSQNKMRMEIKHPAPSWATHYTVAWKQSKGEYQTIYTNLFYEDGLFRWVKLEGANVNKVAAGDQLIVKSDLGGVIPDVRKVRVLEVSPQAEDFISGNENTDGDEIIEEAGYI